MDWYGLVCYGQPSLMVETSAWEDLMAPSSVTTVNFPSAGDIPVYLGLVLCVVVWQGMDWYELLWTGMVWCGMVHFLKC